MPTRSAAEPPVAISPSGLDRLSPAQHRAAEQTKADGRAGGGQYVPNPAAAANAGARPVTIPRGLPIAGYADLNAADAAKAVGGLDDAEQLRAVAAYEQAHGARQTVLRRARSAGRRLN